MSFDLKKPDATQELREALDRIGSRQTCAKGETLFVQGQTADGLRVLCRGHVELYLALPDGTRVSLGAIGPEYILGLSSLFTGKPFGATATAQEQCEFFFVDTERALHLIRSDAALCVEAAIQLARDLSGLR